MNSKRRWHWGFDQWMEDKVWTRVPKEYATPHFFFVAGVFAGMIVFCATLLILRLLQ